MKVLIFPFPRKFAISFVDDTDDATTDKVKRAYAFIDEYGIKSTKTVWAFPAKRKSGDPERGGRFSGGVSLCDSEYLSLIKEIQSRGHEIALHLASGGNNFREDTIAAYNLFKKEFGFFPTINIMHGRNADNLYYGREAFTNPILKFLAGFYSADKSKGHLQGSPFFWGDICKSYTKYVRLFKTTHLNTLSVNPSMPYHDPRKPYVNKWFSSTDLSDAMMMKRNFTEAKLTKLKNDEGVCIGYIYFHHFVDDKLKIDPILEERFDLLRPHLDQCWLTPVSSLLDRIAEIRNLEIKKDKANVQILNHNEHAVKNVCISADKGTRVYIDGEDEVTIGDSGIAVIEEIASTDSITVGQKDRRDNISFKEKTHMILCQAYLLAIRHISGRPLRRWGF